MCVFVFIRWFSPHYPRRKSALIINHIRASVLGYAWQQKKTPLAQETVAIDGMPFSGRSLHLSLTRNKQRWDTGQEDRIDVIRKGKALREEPCGRCVWCANWKNQNVMLISTRLVIWLQVSVRRGEDKFKYSKSISTLWHVLLHPREWQVDDLLGAWWRGNGWKGKDSNIFKMVVDASVVFNHCNFD